MALIATQSVVLTGLLPTFAAAANTDTIAADGRAVLWVVNGAGAPITVTIVSPQTVAGLAVEDVVVTVANATQKLIGPFPRATFGDANGEAGIDYSSITTITRAALEI